MLTRGGVAVELRREKSFPRWGLARNIGWGCGGLKILPHWLGWVFEKPPELYCRSITTYTFFSMGFLQRIPSTFEHPKQILKLKDKQISNENATLFRCSIVVAYQKLCKFVIYNYYLGQTQCFPTKISIPVTLLTHDVTSASKLRY